MEPEQILSVFMPLMRVGALRLFENNGIEGLSKSAPGPKSKLSAEQRQIEQLLKQNAKLNHELAIANGCLELQKKALAMLDLTNNGKDQ